MFVLLRTRALADVNAFVVFFFYLIGLGSFGVDTCYSLNIDYVIFLQHSSYRETCMLSYGTHTYKLLLYVQISCLVAEWLNI